MANVAGIRFQIEQADSIKELKSLRKELQDTFEKAKLGGKVWKEAGDGIDFATKKLNDFNTAARKAKTETMNSYFDTGNALRKFYMEQRVGDRTMREATQTATIFAETFGMKGISGALSSVVGSFQQAEFAIKGTGIAIQGVGGKVADLGAKLVTIGGPIALAVAAVYSLVKGFQDMEKAIADAIKKGQELESAGFLASLSDEEKKIVLQEKLNKLLKERGALRVEETTVGATLLTGGKSLMEAAAQRMTDRQQRADLTAKINALRNEIAALTRFKRPDLGTAAPLPEDIELVPQGFWDTRTYSPSDYFIRKQVQRGGSVMSMSELSGRGMAMGSMQGLGVGAGIGGGVRGPGMVAELPAEWSQAQEVMVELNQGIVTMGRSLSDSLAQGFIKGFQKGENVLESFTSAILTSMANIAAQQVAAFGVAGLLSLIPGVGSFSSIFSALGGLFKLAEGGVINEPVYGVGAKSRKGYLIGESGPEMVSPLSGVSTGGQNSLVQELRAVKQAIRDIHFGVTPEGIYATAERGRMALAN